MNINIRLAHNDGFIVEVYTDGSYSLGSTTKSYVFKTLTSLQEFLFGQLSSAKSPQTTGIASLQSLGAQLGSIPNAGVPCSPCPSVGQQLCSNEYNTTSSSKGY